MTSQREGENGEKRVANWTRVLYNTWMQGGVRKHMGIAEKGREKMKKLYREVF